MKERFPLIKSKNRFVRYFGYIIYSIVGFFAFLIVLATIVAIFAPPSDQSSSKQSSIQKEKEYVNVSFEDFDELFGLRSKLTDYQKKELFEREYKGKYVVWSCELVEVSEDGSEARFRCKPSTWTWDLIVKFRSDQKGKLLKYQKGDIVTVEGMIWSYSELFGHRLTDGIILERG
ncbi:MAG: hypothetical protein PWQ22_1627 [Archaeoglobaceae archaeon]|nr:hypothetical protein [Archaeoglobaceae archaeon]MDK2877217.1 hypothetical protein [Archaeoglobaceae archaeon]